MGYGFVRADPLYGIEDDQKRKVPNFDFLISKPKAKVPILIFGEVKSRITDYSREFADIVSKIDAVRKNMKTIMEGYLQLDKFEKEPIIEYVLAFKSDLVDNVMEYVGKHKFDIILWKANIPARRFYLVRQLKVEDHTLHIHTDHELDRILGNKDGVESRKYAEPVFPQSISLTKLQTIIEALDLNKRPYVIETEPLRRMVQFHFYYLNQKEIDFEVNFIIREGLKIGFLESDVDLPTGSYRISSKAPRWEGLDKALKKKWIKGRLDERQKRAFDTERLVIQDRYLAETRQANTLFSLAGMEEPPYRH